MRGRAGKADEMGSSSREPKRCAYQEGFIMNGSPRTATVDHDAGLCFFMLDTRTCVDEIGVSVGTFLCRDGVFPFRHHLSFYALGHTSSKR